MTPTVSLGDHVEQVRGVAFAKNISTTMPGPGLVPVATATNITEAGYKPPTNLHVPEEFVADKQRLRRGDILLTASSGSLKVVGRAVLVDSDDVATFGAFCKVLRPTSSLEAAYLAHYLRTKTYRSTVARAATGANINNLRSSDIDALQLPLPALPEQRRLADILDIVDGLREKRRAVLALLQELHAVILQSSFSNGSASYDLGQVLTVRTGKFLPASARSEGGDVPVYGANGQIGWHDSALYIDPQVIVGRVGSAGEVHVTTGPSWVSDNALVCSWDEARISRTFLVDVLRAAQLGQYASTTAQPLLSASRLKSVKISLPKLADQRRYEVKREVLLRAQKSAAAHLAYLDELFASLQHRAFTGQL